MAKIGTAYVDVEAETKKFEAQLSAAAKKAGVDAGKTVGDGLGKGLAKNQSAAKGFSSVLSSAQKTMAGLAIAAGAVGTVGAGLLSAADSASALNEQISGAQQTFGKASTSVRDFASTAASSIGISAAAALKAANAYGAFFKQAGFAQDAAARYSTTLVQLAGDLASFKDVSVEDATSAISSGLAGESEPLRRLGVDLRQTKVDAEALALGFATTAAELTETDRVAARYSSLLRQTSDAQTDAARTAAEYANTQRRFTAELENFKAEAGQAFLPTLTNITRGFELLLNTVNQGSNPFGGITLSLETFANAAKGFATGGFVGALGAASKDTSDKIAAAAKVYNDALGTYGKNSPQATDAARIFREEVEKAEKAAQSSAEGLESLAQAAARVNQGMLTALGGVQAYVASQRTVADAERAVRDARSSVIDADQRLADLRARGKVDLEKVADGERDLAAATRTTIQARRALADAEAEVKKLRAGPSANEKGDVARSVARADLELVRARNRLAELKRERPTKERTGAEIALDVKSAELDIADAIDRQNDVRKEQQDILNRGKPGSRELVEALDREEQARRDLADKVAAEKKAGDDLREARKGDPTFERDLAKAIAEAAAARERVKRAEEDLPAVTEAARLKQQEFALALAQSSDAADRLREALGKLGIVAPTADLPPQQATQRPTAGVYVPGLTTVTPNAPTTGPGAVLGGLVSGASASAPSAPPQVTINANGLTASEAQVAVTAGLGWGLTGRGDK